MKRSFLVTLALTFILSLQVVMAAQGPKFSYMRLVVIGNLTEPVMLITDQNGKQEQIPMLVTLSLNREKSLTNISENEEELLKKLNDLGNQGWELFSVETSGSQIIYSFKKQLP